MKEEIMSFDAGNNKFWNNFFNTLSNVQKIENENNTKEAEKNVQAFSDYAYHEETADEDIVFEEESVKDEPQRKEIKEQGLDADKVLYDSEEKSLEERKIIRTKYASPDMLWDEPVSEQERVFKYAIYDPDVVEDIPVEKYAMPDIPDPEQPPTPSAEPTPSTEPTPSAEPTPSIPAPEPATPARPKTPIRGRSRGDGTDVTQWGGWISSFFGRGKNVDLSNPWSINRAQTFVNVLSTATESFAKRLEGFIKDIFPNFRR